MQAIIYMTTIVFMFIIGYICFNLLSRLFSYIRQCESTLNTAQVLTLKLNYDGRIIEANDIFYKKTGYVPEEIIGKAEFLNLMENVRGESINLFVDRLVKDSSVKPVFSITDKSGKKVYLSWSGFENQASTGVVKYYLLIGTDVTGEEVANEEIERLRSEKEKISADLGVAREEWDRHVGYLEENEAVFNETQQRYSFIMESIGHGVWQFDYTAHSMYISEKCFHTFGSRTVSDFFDIKYGIYGMLSTDDYYLIMKSLYKTMTEGVISFSCTLELNGESKRWLEIQAVVNTDGSGHPMQLVGSLKDITDSKIHSDKVNKIAYYDELTGLPNIRCLEEYVDKCLRQHPEHFSALIIIDIDELKFINNSFGRVFGDGIIKTMAKRLSEFVANLEHAEAGFYSLDGNPGGNPADAFDGLTIVCKSNGDEAVIYIPKYTDEEYLAKIVSNLKSVLNFQYTEHDVNYKINVSMGVATYPQHGAGFSSLMANAETALRKAQSTGKNKAVFFDDSMSLQTDDRKKLENELKSALEGANDGLYLYLQPQYETETGKLYGFESLTRWKTEDQRFIPPGIFIPVAEETRLIMPLGKWVLRESCLVLNELSRRGYPDIKITVNLSTKQLMDYDLVAGIGEILEETGAAAHNLVLEITESILMENLDANIKILSRLKELGISIALDDFGKGYSSLTHLKLLPLNILKIDKVFIDTITNSETDKKIIREIVELAHIFGFKTIAEGVETAAQFEHLKRTGCDMIQGYYGGKPMPKDEIFAVVDRKLIHA